MPEIKVTDTFINDIQLRLDAEYRRANVAEARLKELSDVEAMKMSYEQQLSERDNTIKEKDEKIAKLEAKLQYAMRKLWGKMSEKRRIPDDPNELKLDFGEEELTEEEKQSLKQAEQAIENQRRKVIVREHEKSIPIRQKLPPELEHKENHIYPEGYLGHEEEWTLFKKTEVSEHLEFVPEHMFVRVDIRHKGMRKDTKEIVEGKPSVEPIAKSYATVSLLTEIIANKYAYHIPFYRQMEMLKSSSGMKIPQSTIESWFSGVADLMRPAYFRLREFVLAQDYVQADETTIPIVNNEKHKTVKGYFWLVRSVMNKALFLHYDKGSRAAAVAWDIFKGYKGAISVDGYDGYSFLKKQDGDILLRCWVHLRRYFDRALTNDKKRAEIGIDQIAKLYTIETMADEENLSYEERCELRMRVAHPIIVAFEKWCINEYPKVLPKSPIGKALHYMVDYGRELSHYLLDGRYLMDNNQIENCVRPLAVGRKGYLFCGNDSAAEDAAVIYSMMGTCKSVGVDFREWLSYFLTHVHDYDDDYSRDLVELLPPYLLEHGILKSVNDRL